jgi:phage terminase small subunit
MPPLKNARHELAALYRVAGHSQIDAYEKAGYSRKSHHACSKLFARDDVRARLRELQDEMAERVVEWRTVTLENLTEDMLANRRLAVELRQLSVAQTASRDLARMHGFMNEKSVHYHKSVDDMTEAELAALVGDGDDHSEPQGKPETAGRRSGPPAASRHQTAKIPP